MGFTWYCLGLLTTGSTIFLWHFSKRYRLNWLSWSGLTLGIALILFSIAWSVGSVLEGVPRAASMGLLLFGLSGIALLTLAFRYTFTKRPKMFQPEAETALIYRGDERRCIDNIWCIPAQEFLPGIQPGRCLKFNT